ncbi:MAG: dienelactone hydrolase family protein [Acidimicrobiia bacterium]
MSDAGTGYLVHPDAGPGPGVLLLHSWWGLTDQVKDLANQLADAGFTALAPDLLAGAHPETSAEAELTLEAADIDATAGLVLSSATALRSQTRDPRAPVGVVGYSMGASWAYWLSVRLPQSVSCVVSYYGTQNIEFDDSQSSYLVHIAETDELASDDETNETLALLGLAGRPFDVYRYDETQHWFAEPDRPGHHEAAAALAWDRTIAFLADHLQR